VKPSCFGRAALAASVPCERVGGLTSVDKSFAAPGRAAERKLKAWLYYGKGARESANVCARQSRAEGKMALSGHCWR
jgi:hypothetical protein